MAFMISTGLRNHLLTGGSFKNGMDGFVVRVYGNDGAVPATADAAVGSATLLAILSVDGLGGGGTFESAPVSGVLSKETTEELFGTILATGTASFFRLSATADTGASSTTEKRLQGTVGTVDADFLVRDINFVADEEQRVDSINLGMPASA